MMNKAEVMMRHASVLKVVAETTMFEVFSPLPPSSDTCLSIGVFKAEI